jgi:hypothetical protein
VVHGNPASCQALCALIKNRLGWVARAAAYMEEINLE